MIRLAWAGCISELFVLQSKRLVFTFLQAASGQVMPGPLPAADPELPSTLSPSRVYLRGCLTCHGITALLIRDQTDVSSNYQIQRIQVEHWRTA